jgi:hypothetical protein
MERDPALQGLIDRQVITDTLFRYASTTDRKDYVGLRDLFSENAHARFGKRDWLVGADQIVDWMAEHSREQAWQHHLLSVYHVDIDGDVASALTYHTSRQTTVGDLDTVKEIVARYHDQLHRIGNTWKIVRKEMEVCWRETRKALQPTR